MQTATGLSLTGERFDKFFTACWGKNCIFGSWYNIKINLRKQIYMEKQLFLGDEAIAQAAIDAGISGVYAYPGTPSTEITEYIQGSAVAKERGIHSRWTERGSRLLYECRNEWY